MVVTSEKLSRKWNAIDGNGFFQLEWKSATSIHVDVRSSPTTRAHAHYFRSKSSTVSNRFYKEHLDKDIHYRNWVIVPPRTSRTRDHRFLIRKHRFKFEMRVRPDYAFSWKFRFELFVDDERYMVQRIYPTRSDSTDVSVVPDNGELRIQSWQYGS